MRTSAERKRATGRFGDRVPFCSLLAGRIERPHFGFLRSEMQLLNISSFVAELALPCKSLVR